MKRNAMHAVGLQIFMKLKTRGRIDNVISGSIMQTCVHTHAVF